MKKYYADRMNSNSVNKMEIPVLYTLRGMAALSVCLFHFITTTSFIYNPVMLTIFKPGAYGVEMFFVISGFVIPLSMYYAGYEIKNLFTFLIKRLARLEPPYIVSIGIALVISALRQKFIVHAPGVTFNFTQIALHFGYLIPFFKGYAWLNQSYWTLAIEFQYYLFMSVFFLVLVKSPQVVRILLCALGVAISLLISGQFFPRFFPVFLLGMLLFMKKINKIQSGEFYIVSSGTFIFCLFTFSLSCNAFILLAVIAILFFEQLDFKIGRFFGNISYSLYLIHPLIGESFVNIFAHQDRPTYIKAFIIIGALVITIGTSYVFYWLVEKPSRRFSGKIKYLHKAEENNAGAVYLPK